MPTVQVSRTPMYRILRNKWWDLNNSNFFPKIFTQNVVHRMRYCYGVLPSVNQPATMTVCPRRAEFQWKPASAESCRVCVWHHHRSAAIMLSPFVSLAATACLVSDVIIQTPARLLPCVPQLWSEESFSHFWGKSTRWRWQLRYDAVESSSKFVTLFFVHVHPGEEGVRSLFYGGYITCAIKHSATAFSYLEYVRSGVLRVAKCGHSYVNGYEGSSTPDAAGPSPFVRGITCISEHYQRHCCWIGSV